MLVLDQGMGYDALLKLLLFAFFIVTRAIHPLLLEASKEGGKMLYAKNTVIVVAKISIVALMNIVAFAQGGWAGLRQCWQPRCLCVFGIIGGVYSLGDFLEMLSMAKLGGGVYQILLQTKLLITALMLWYMKGTRQTPLQAHVLFSMFLAMSAFVIVDMGDESGNTGSSMSVGAICCVMLKVAVSCYCAVLSEKYLKEFNSLPFYAKISSLSTTWAVTSVLFLVTAERMAISDGFFANWNWGTVSVVVSFIVKTLSTQYLLQKLDSVQKNIGEALAVIVIYGAQVALSNFDKSFELSVFLLALLVVALVKTYLLSSPERAPSEKQKERRRPRIATQRVNVVAVNSQGTHFMKQLGRNTIKCEVEEELPSGIFYGMLGDVHPVCGNTHSEDPKKCELMMLSEAVSNETFIGEEASAPFLLKQSLTVLGKLRDPLPKKALTQAQFEHDIEEARVGIADLCMYRNA